MRCVQVEKRQPWLPFFIVTGVWNPSSVPRCEQVSVSDLLQCARYAFSRRSTRFSSRAIASRSARISVSMPGSEPRKKHGLFFCHVLDHVSNDALQRSLLSLAKGLAGGDNAVRRNISDQAR